MWDVRARSELVTVPGSIRDFDQVLVDHLLEQGFVHYEPQELVIPERVTVLMPQQLQGAAAIWWWNGPPPANPSLNRNQKEAWAKTDIWTDWVFRQQVIQNFPREALIWDAIARELAWDNLIVARQISDWIS